MKNSDLKQHSNWAKAAAKHTQKIPTKARVIWKLTKSNEDSTSIEFDRMEQILENLITKYQKKFQKRKNQNQINIVKIFLENY